MQQTKPDFLLFQAEKHIVLNILLKHTFDLLDLDYKKYLKVDKKLLRPSKD